MPILIFLVIFFVCSAPWQGWAKRRAPKAHGFVIFMICVGMGLLVILLLSSIAWAGCMTMLNGIK